MDCAEAYVKFCCSYLLERCRDDMEFIASRYDKEAISRVEKAIAEPFKRLSYTEAVALLEEHGRESTLEGIGRCGERRGD
jgi:asparaginyl-tRNA synthetase